MGGHALKNTITVRKELKEYLEIKQYIFSKLTESGINHKEVKELPNKKNFGDLDVLITDVEDKEALVNQFDPIDVFVNGTVISFASRKYNDFQIDFIFTNNIIFSHFYYSFADTGAIIGRITDAYGMKFCYNYLKLMHYPIILSENIEEVCRFLGLSYNRWQAGFTHQNEIFEWIITSSFYQKDLFKTLNCIHRKRVEKRSFYKDFLNYIGVSVTAAPLIKKQPDITEYLKYFDKTTEYSQILENESQRKFIKEKYNGNLFLELGIKPLELKEIKEAFENSMENFEEWVFTTDKEAIYARIKEFLN